MFCLKLLRFNKISVYPGYSPYVFHRDDPTHWWKMRAPMFSSPWYAR